jgi:hypothetical protein
VHVLRPVAVDVEGEGAVGRRAVVGGRLHRVDELAVDEGAVHGVVDAVPSSRSATLRRSRSSTGTSAGGRRGGVEQVAEGGAGHDREALGGVRQTAREPARPRTRSALGALLAREGAGDLGAHGARSACRSTTRSPTRTRMAGSTACSAARSRGGRRRGGRRRRARGPCRRWRRRRRRSRRSRSWRRSRRRAGRARGPRRGGRARRAGRRRWRRPCRRRPRRRRHARSGRRPRARLMRAPAGGATTRAGRRSA